MAYRTDFVDAARRYLQAADCLHDREPPCRVDVAGYLYGIAAECAIKEILRRSRLWSKPDLVHFPELKVVLRDNASGRYAGSLRKFAEDGAFMSEWNIAMRYAPKSDISPVQVKRWRMNARDAIAAMDGC